MESTNGGPTLDNLRARRQEIIRVAGEYGASNIRVFGSVARGDAQTASDVDLLVDIDADATGFAYFGLIEDLRDALAEVIGIDVDIVDSAALRLMRERVLREAVSL